MALPLVAAAAIQTAVPIIKKNPWIVAVIAFLMVFPTIMLITAVGAGFQTLGSLNRSGTSECSPQWISVTALFEQDSILKSFLNKPCDDKATEQPVSYSKDGWTFPISATERVNTGGEYGPRPDVCARFHAASCFHQGDDITASCATPIHAVQDGTVVKAALSGGLGYYTEIDHGNGVHSGYAHQPQGGQRVKVGDHVSSGQVIGIVGSTGASEACHLHFQILINGKLKNPRWFMNTVGIDIGKAGGTPNNADN